MKLVTIIGILNCILSEANLLTAIVYSDCKSYVQFSGFLRLCQ